MAQSSGSPGQGQGVCRQILCAGWGTQHARAPQFDKRYPSAARFSRRGSGSSQQGQEGSPTPGSWLRRDLPRQLPASAKLVLLRTHMGTAVSRALPPSLGWTQDSYGAGTTRWLNAKCLFKKKAGWRQRAHPCPPLTRFCTNHQHASLGHSNHSFCWIKPRGLLACILQSEKSTLPI